MSTEDIPKLLEESSDSSDEEKWEEVEEAEEAEETRCLFSERTFATLHEALNFARTAFNFDLAEIKAKHAMDFYSYIKVINPVRCLLILNDFTIILRIVNFMIVFR